MDLGMLLRTNTLQMWPQAALIPQDCKNNPKKNLTGLE